MASSVTKPLIVATLRGGDFALAAGHVTAVPMHDRALSVWRDPIRQTRDQLSGVYQARINPNLVAR